MLIPVIMAGGTGSRLWPLSRALFPKQFLNLDNKASMLQNTVSRLKLLDHCAPILICNEEHRFLAAEQLNEINALGKTILEPEGKNTAPAVALAALTAMEEYPEEDPILLVLAADHIIQNENVFCDVIAKAIPLAEAGKLVTFGIVPTEAHTGYGYIKSGAAVEKGKEAYNVEEFVEKPDKTTAEQYLSSNKYLWNSGMFLFRASRYIEELEKFNPAISSACQRALMNKKSDLDFIRIDAAEFSKCPEDSIDYAVMEKTQDAVVVPLDAGWSDIGSWSALWDVSEKDKEGNSVQGDSILHNTQNCYIHSKDKLITTIGLNNIVIVDTKDALLVANKDDVQDVKTIVQTIKDRGLPHTKLHREVYRPWGVYDSIDKGDRYQVKRITVKPGAKLSVQMHHHRAEHWIVVSGTAKITNGDKEFLLTENQSTYIPIGVIHALENPGKVPLELIEVQSGSYLGEDDIIRFEDRYGRISD